MSREFLKIATWELIRCLSVVKLVRFENKWIFKATYQHFVLDNQFITKQRRQKYQGFSV